MRDSDHKLKYEAGTKRITKLSPLPWLAFCRRTADCILSRTRLIQHPSASNLRQAPFSIAPKEGGLENRKATQANHVAHAEN